MKVLAVDPGSTKSALVTCNVDLDAPPLAPPWGVQPLVATWHPNEEAVEALTAAIEVEGGPWALVIETMPTVFAGAAARDQLEAARWAGQFIRRYRDTCNACGGTPWVLEVARASAKAATIGLARGTDAQVRRALIDGYGGDTEAFGARCKPCKGRGWSGRGRPICTHCDGRGWHTRPGPLADFPKGSHCYAALACAWAVAQPGGALRIGRGCP